MIDRGFGKMAMVQTLSVGLAFCFLLNLLGSAVPAKHRSDLVYCPLQKAWVEGSRQKVETARVDLDDICAADMLKSTFLLAISSRIKIETSADDDSFFNFIRSGVIGPGSPNAPRYSPGHFGVQRHAKGCDSESVG